MTELLPQYQGAVYHWQGLLEATGGAIEPKKSFVYFLDFKWMGTKWEYTNIQETPGVGTVRSPHTGAVEELTQLEPHIARKSLGIMMAMDSNQ